MGIIEREWNGGGWWLLLNGDMLCYGNPRSQDCVMDDDGGFGVNKVTRVVVVVVVDDGGGWSNMLCRMYHVWNTSPSSKPFLES